MSEKTMRKWGAWAASAVFVVLAILGVAKNGETDAKRTPAISPPAASGEVVHFADADRDVLELQLD